MAPIVREIAKSIRIIALALTTQPDDPMLGNTLENLWRKLEALQVIQPIQQPTRPGRVAPDLELAQPDEPGQPIVDHVLQQGIESPAEIAAQTVCDPRLDPALGDDEGVGTKPFDRGDGRQDRPGPATLLDETAGDILVRDGEFGLILQPSLHVPDSQAREGPVAVDLPQGRHVLVSRFLPRGVVVEIGVPQAELGGKEAGDLGRDEFLRQESTSGVAQRTELQGEAEPVPRPAAPVDMRKVLVRERVVLQ